MFTFWFDFWRRRRQAGYREYLRSNPIDVNDTQHITQWLADTWRSIKPNDLLTVSAKLQAVHHLHCWTPNLPALIDVFQHANKYIISSEDDRFEKLVYQMQERHTVSLEFYFADNDHRRIDELTQLTRLKGLLQEHHYLLKDKENQYYQRLSTRFYEDVMELTTALVALAT